MRALRRLRAVPRFAREIAGLFFDDGSLAMVVLSILAAAAILAKAAGFDGLQGIAFLVGGVIAALLENVVRTARGALSWH
jgi:hypothetical protein